jgi:hypothetical protein
VTAITPAHLSSLRQLLGTPLARTTYQSRPAQLFVVNEKAVLLLWHKQKGVTSGYRKV